MGVVPWREEVKRSSLTLRAGRARASDDRIELTQIVGGLCAVRTSTTSSTLSPGSSRRSSPPADSTSMIPVINNKKALGSRRRDVRGGKYLLFG